MIDNQTPEANTSPDTGLATEEAAITNNLATAAGILAKAINATEHEKVAEALIDRKKEHSEYFANDVFNMLSNMASERQPNMKYFQDKFPELLEKDVNDKDISDHEENLNFEIFVKAKGVLAEILASPAKLDISKQDSIKDTAISVAGAGEKLLKDGPICHSAGIEAMAIVMALFSRLPIISKNEFKRLEVAAHSLANLIRPWLTAGTSYNITNILKAFKKDRDEATNWSGEMRDSFIVAAVEYTAFYDVFWVKVWRDIDGIKGAAGNGAGGLNPIRVFKKGRQLELTELAQEAQLLYVSWSTPELTTPNQAVSMCSNALK